MKKYSLGTLFKESARAFSAAVNYLFRGAKERQFMAHAKQLARLLTDRFETFKSVLDEKDPNAILAPTASSDSKKELFFSVLVPVYHPDPLFLEKALFSALSQKPEKLEVWVGFDGPQSQEVYEVIEKLSGTFPERLFSLSVDRKRSLGGISATTNELGKVARGSFFILMDHDDWMHPDLLAHYGEALRDDSTSREKVLFCNEYKINEKDAPLPGTYLEKPQHPPFPYVFNNYICHCLAVPKVLWDKVGGLRSECNGAQDFDLVLRLELAGAKFENVPLYLYAWRIHSQSTAGNSGQKSYASDAGLKALKEYVSKKNLNWEMVDGCMPLTYRAIPRSKRSLAIHIITSPGIEGSYMQDVWKGPSDYPAVRRVTQLKEDDLRKNSFELLCNQIIEGDRESEAFLFLDPKVELKADSLEEMGRWIGQPSIGAVSCRIRFPEAVPSRGPLYFGKETFRRDDLRLYENTLGSAEALYQGCLLVSRKAFLDAGGFEIDSPSPEIDLAVDMKNKGWISFYTPYAEGIYHR